MSHLLPTNLSLNVGGYDISGWESAAIHLGIDLLPWAASLQVSFPDLTGFSQKFPGINVGANAVLFLNRRPLITGRLITISEEITPEAHIFSMEISSKTLDLTDCAASIPKNQMNATNLTDIAQQICDNFNIDVLQDTSVVPFEIPAFSMVLSETPFAVLDRLCRLQGILFIDTPEGNILLTGVGAQMMASPLVLGENVENISRQRSISGRYNEIRAILNNEMILFVDPDKAAGQTPEQQIAGLTQCAPAYDPAIPATRKLFVPIEQNDQNYSVTQKRVAWEIARRKGRACPIHVTVDSWLDEAGNVWMPNKKVTLNTMNQLQILLITEVELIKNINGTRATLTLMDPASFEPQPIVNQFENAQLTQALKH